MLITADDARLIAEYERAKAVRAYRQLQASRIYHQRLRYIEAVQGAPFGKPLFVQTEDGSYRIKTPQDRGQGFVRTSEETFHPIEGRDAARQPMGSVYVYRNGGWVAVATLESGGPFFVKIRELRYRPWRPLGTSPPPASLRQYKGRSFTQREFLTEMGFAGGMTKAEAAALWETLPIVYAESALLRRAQEWERHGREFPDVQVPMGTRRAIATFGDVLSGGYLPKHPIGEDSPLAIGRYAPGQKQEFRKPLTKPDLFPTRASLRYWTPAPEQRAYFEEAIATPGGVYTVADVARRRAQLAEAERARAAQAVYLAEYQRRFR